MQRLKTGIGAIINFSLPATGLGLTAHFLMRGQWLEALGAGVATGLVGLFTLGRKFSDRVLARLQTRLDERADALGDWLFDQLEGRLQTIWWGLSGNFRNRYNQALIYRYRDYPTRGLSNPGPFALDLEKVFVPLRLSPESLSHISPRLIRLDNNTTLEPSPLLERRETRGDQIWTFLQAMVSQPAFDRLAILGAPGSGKTTLLEHLTLIYARGLHRRRDRRAPNLLPVLLYLREVREQLIGDAPPDLTQLINQQLELDGLTPPPRWIAEQLNQGKALVMLDGLDEIADLRQRQRVSRWVERQMRRYRQAPFIVTSRPSGYREAPLEGITTLEVQPFNLEQMQRFVQNWYLQNETIRHLGKSDRGVRQMAQQQADDLMGRIRKTPALAAMALNPLLLSMIATVHCYRGALPGRRVELYGEICDVLLGRRQDLKGLPDALTTKQKKHILQALALKLMGRRSRTFKTFAGKVLIQKELDAMAGDSPAVLAEDFLQQIEVNSGLLVERHPGLYEFAHKSLQEYLAARQVKFLKREVLLTRAIEDPWWEETIRLYAAQNDASSLIWFALQKNSVNALSLAYDCLEEGLSVAPDVTAELGHRLDAGLESNDAKIFELAAEVKLERRLKRLLRLDENTDLDLDYISNAEYQLFLNEQRRDGDACPPDHWSQPRFPSGMALAPVTGLRASDAQAFCHWLTQRINSLGAFYLEAGVTVFSGPLRIRLPRLGELQQHPAQQPAQQHPLVSSWCLTPSRELAVAPPAAHPAEQPTTEAEELDLAAHQGAIAQRCVELLVRDTGFVFDPILKHALRFSNALMCSQVAGLLNRALSLSHDPLHLAERDLALQRLTALDFSSSLGEGSPLVRDRDLLLHLAAEWSEAGSEKVARALDRQGKHRPKASRTPLLPAPDILLICAFWQIAASLYSNLARRRRILKRNAIIRQDCDFLSNQYQMHSEDALSLYLFMALKDDRRHNGAQPWEGLRIIRCKTDTKQ